MVVILVDVDIGIGIGTLWKDDAKSHNFDDWVMYYWYI